MSDIIPLHGDTHVGIQELLPWYAAGTLEPEDQVMVDAHLEHCAACQAELKFDHRLLGLVAEPLPGVEQASVEHGLAAIRRAIASEMPKARPRPARQPFAPVFAILRRPLKLGWFLAAEAVALALLAIVGHPGTIMPYRALATPRSAAPGNVIVIFRDDARERETRFALLASGGRVVDGPTAAGAYILSIPVDPGRGLAQLRAAPVVVLAEPLDSAKP